MRVPLGPTETRALAADAEAGATAGQIYAHAEREPDALADAETHQRKTRRRGVADAAVSGRRLG
jgi:hypothetical protein